MNVFGRLALVAGAVTLAIGPIARAEVGDVGAALLQNLDDMRTAALVATESNISCNAEPSGGVVNHTTGVGSVHKDAEEYIESTFECIALNGTNFTITTYVEDQYLDVATGRFTQSGCRTAQAVTPSVRGLAKPLMPSLRTCYFPALISDGNGGYRANPVLNTYHRAVAVIESPSRSTYVEPTPYVWYVF